MENSVTIKFEQMSQVYDFLNEIRNFKSDIDLLSANNHRYCIDAKSILGVLALDISNVLIVRILSENEEEIKEFFTVMGKYKYVDTK